MFLSVCGPFTQLNQSRINSFFPATVQSPWTACCYSCIGDLMSVNEISAMDSSAIVLLS